jgi:DNA-binding HxlR family transcriptional regulator
MSDIISYNDFLATIEAGPQSDDNCPVVSVIVMLQGKWKALVLFELCKHKTIRFGELKKALPLITNTMLTSTLRELEEDGLVRREQFNKIPPHVEYTLTSKGSGLLPVFYEMCVWKVKNGK